VWRLAVSNVSEELTAFIYSYPGDFQISCPTACLLEDTNSGLVRSYPLHAYRMAFPMDNPHCYPLCCCCRWHHENVRRLVLCSLYIDNFAICYRSQSLPTIDRQLRLTIHRLSLWSQENGFRFSVARSRLSSCVDTGEHFHIPVFLWAAVLCHLQRLGFLGLI
jgi:hypothetical protein